jgi:hypothetical protein
MIPKAHVDARRAIAHERYRTCLAASELHRGVAMSNNLKDKIDNAADKAKDLADKAASTIKDASKKVADKTHDAADKIEEHGTDASKKVGG